MLCSGEGEVGKSKQVELSTPSIYTEAERETSVGPVPPENDDES